MDDFAELQEPQKEIESLKTPVSEKEKPKEQRKTKNGSRRSKNDPTI